MSFLYFVIFIFVLCLIGIIWIGVVFWRHVRMFNNAVHGRRRGAYGRYGEEMRQHHEHVTSNGDVIIDKRSSEEKSRKIFTDNEGEYVDYKKE